MKAAVYKSLSDFWSNKKREFLDECTLCGSCMEICPIIQYTDYADDDPVEAMERYNRFLESGGDAEAAHKFMKTCMGCGLCADVCPIGTELHQIAKDFSLSDLNSAGYPLPKQQAELPENPHNIYHFFAALQDKPQDRYSKWTMSIPANPPRVDTIYFPSCSSAGLVKRLFDMMDIIEMIGMDYLALSPFDIDICCGCMHLRSGLMEKAEYHARRLVKALAAFQPKMVVMGCPHTYWWMRDFVPLFEPYDFQVQHQMQFIADHLDKLDFRPMDTIVAYHDSCGIGRWAGHEYDAPRKILNSMPGVDYRELPRNREQSACCAAGGPIDVHLEKIHDRLQEVKAQGANVLTSVCAGCVMAFQKQVDSYQLDAMNIINFVAEGLGIHNEDLLMKCIQLGDVDKIVEATRTNFARSTFSEDKIRSLISHYLLATRTLGVHDEKEPL